MQTDRTSQQITLIDGRQLAFAEYGDPGGFPIFLLHGTPGSRLWFVDDDPDSKSLGIRLITTDRPGYGRSTTHAERKVLDTASDIEALADHLGIARFSVIGISGGGVYSAACAYGLPDRVVKAGLVATIDQFVNGKAPKGMCRPNRMFFWMARKWPRLARYVLGGQKKLLEKDPERYISASQKQVSHLCPSDQEVVRSKENAEFTLLHMREAFVESVDGAVYEAALLTSPWGFNLEEIKVPVEIWHGEEDTLAPIAPMKNVAERLHSATAHFIPEKGHFLDDDPEVWREILKSVLPTGASDQG